MTREEFDNLNADGRDRCPNCGSNGFEFSDLKPKERQARFTEECKNKCGRKPFQGKGEGIRHINKYHHRCE